MGVAWYLVGVANLIWEVCWVSGLKWVWLVYPFLQEVGVVSASWVWLALCWSCTIRISERFTVVGLLY